MLRFINNYYVGRWVAVTSYSGDTLLAFDPADPPGSVIHGYTFNQLIWRSDTDATRVKVLAL